jgi:hypothetical protein
MVYPLKFINQGINGPIKWDSFLFTQVPAALLFRYELSEIYIKQDLMVKGQNARASFCSYVISIL